MNLAVSNAPSPLTGANVLSGTPAAPAGDAFTLLIGLGVDPVAGETPQVSQPAPNPEAAAAVAPSPAVASAAVAAAEALVAGIAPDAPVENVPPPAEAKPIASPIAQPVLRRADPRLPGKPVTEKKEEEANTGDKEKPAATGKIALIEEPAILVVPVAYPEAKTAPVEAPGADKAKAVDIAAPVSGNGAAVPSKQAAAPAIQPNDVPAIDAIAGALAQSVEALPDAAKPGPAEIEIAPTVAEAVSVALPAAEEDKPSTARAAQIAPRSAGPADSKPATVTPPPAKPAKAQIAVEKAVDSIELQTNAPIPMSRPAAPDAPVAAQAVQAALPAAPADVVVDRQLDLVRNEQWLGELAHDIANASGDNQKLNFKLMPPQLGRLDVDLSRAHNGGLSLTIRTETDSAQAILTAAQPRLIEEMRSQGLKLADTQMFSGDMRQSSNQGGSGQPAPVLIEAFTTPAETLEAPHETVRDGRYA